MTTYRRAALTLATCASGLTLAACSAGITSASPPKTPTAPASHQPASSPVSSASSASPASSPASSPTAVTAHVAGVGSFPIPSGAQVLTDLACGKGSALEVGPVTPVAAQAFYAAALPKAGYTITMNTLSSDPTTGKPDGIAEMMFAGHGYSGLIIAATDLSSSGASASAAPALSGSLAHNVMEISLAPGSNPAAMPSC
jgi:hypothetical protein